MSDKEHGLTALVWMHGPSKYSGTELVVMLKLAGLSSNKEGHAWVRVKVLATMCGVDTRQVRRVLKKLKKDGLLKVQHRKGHSNRFFLNAEELKALPLVIAPRAEEQSQEAEQPKAPQPSPAEVFAGMLHTSVLKEVAGAHVPEGWKAGWVAEIQKLTDAGHTVDVMRKVARFALDTPFWSNQLRENAPQVLVANFTKLLEQQETFGKKAA